MSRAKTGALWERSDDGEKPDDTISAESQLFLNQRAQRDFRINEKFRKKARKEFGKTLGADDQEEDETSGGDQKGPEEEKSSAATAKSTPDDDDDSEDEAKKRKKKKEEQACTKEEYAVAKHLRFNAPTHTGKLAGMTVKCFIASQAVDCLLDSKWSKSKANPDSEIVFTDRKSVVQFLNRYIEKGLFHRADKVDSRKDKAKKLKKKDEEDKTKKSKKKKEEEEQEEEKKEAEKKKTKTEVKLKKFKLNMSDDQRFVDGNNIYVWIYDPIQPKTFVIGFFMLLGAIALCLFPLWPDWIRVGVYYCSLAGASFVGLMLVLIVLRVIIFSIVWVLTLGKHHLWIFPNLTEDVGVIESFKPLYKHDIYPPPELEKVIEKEKARKKTDAVTEDDDHDDDDNDNDDDGENRNENDFEMVDSRSENERTGGSAGEDSEN